MMKVARAGLVNAWTLKEGEEPPLAAHLVTPRRGYIHHGLMGGSSITLVSSEACTAER